MATIEITYFSDVLCIWAYIADRRVEELARNFGEHVAIENRYCSVFPDAWGKLEAKGGFEHFNTHLRDVAARFPHITLHDGVWLKARPRTSASAHLFLKAVQLIEGETLDAVPYLDRISTRAAHETRLAFFARAEDIADWHVHRDIAERLGLDYSAVEVKIRTSEAVAALAVDYDLSRQKGIEGSPTFVMNDGRQKLFGNVGYRLLEANVQELLRAPAEDEASWC